MSGWSWGWPEQHRGTLIQVCPLLGNTMTLLSSQRGRISFHLIQMFIVPLPCASHIHSSGHYEK